MELGGGTSACGASTDTPDESNQNDQSDKDLVKLKFLRDTMSTTLNLYELKPDFLDYV